MAIPDYYFHYTSREFAQSIASAGQLVPGIGGIVYLTRELYEMGTDAVDWLAIVNKPVEVVGLVPGTLVGDLPDAPVPHIRDPHGRLSRRGGGTQVRAKHAIPAADIKWLALSPP